MKTIEFTEASWRRLETLSEEVGNEGAESTVYTALAVVSLALDACRAGGAVYTEVNGKKEVLMESSNIGGSSR